jgi:two-component system cell cycle response regulator
VRVLIADDDPVSRRLLQVTLSNSGYETVMANDGAEALHALEQQDCPRLLILDWIMPKMDGIEVCRAIRKRGAEPYLYVILLTVKGQQREIIEGLEAGADDYVTKPFDLLELKARLRAGRRILELQDQLIASREELRFEATHDTQTGLLNHGAILELLRKELLRSQREGTPLGVIMLDLDHFKLVNDQYGHLVGDSVLREVSRRLKLSIRPYDSVGRYGGEEFVVVAPGCNLENAKSLAERLRASVSSEPIQDSAVSISVTASLGVSSALGAKGPDQVLRATDEALYTAKLEGRNRVVVQVSSEATSVGVQSQP